MPKYYYIIVPFNDIIIIAIISVNNSNNNTIGLLHTKENGKHAANKGAYAFKRERKLHEGAFFFYVAK